MLKKRIIAFLFDSFYTFVPKIICLVLSCIWSVRARYSLFIYTHFKL